MTSFLSHGGDKTRANKYLLLEVFHKLPLSAPSIRNMLLVESGCTLHLQIPVDCFLQCHFGLNFRERPGVFGKKFEIIMSNVLNTITSQTALKYQLSTYL